MNPEWPLVRQTPGARGQWNDCTFTIDRPAASGDWWFVYNDLTCPTRMVVGHTVLLTPEPPALKSYGRRFLSQFDFVVTADRNLKHPNKIYSHQALPWHVGREQSNHRNIRFTKGYDELKARWPIPKNKLVSVITSSQSTTPSHAARHQFVQRLAAHFGSRMEIFGRGHREIPDKWDGIAPFRYHVALENSSHPDYWTEKLSDAFLAGAFPIYYGAPNINQYFDKTCFAEINIQNPDRAIDCIEKVLIDDPYDECALKTARDALLDRYNIFPFLAEFATSRTPVGAEIRRRPVKLLPASAFNKRPLLSRIAGRIRAIL